MWNNPNLRFALAIVMSLHAIATIFFHFVEGWSLFDSFYFSVITMSTVGYGNIVPATVLGKIGVIVLIFSGVGALAVLVQIITSDAVERRTRRLEEEVDEERALLEQLEQVRRRKPMPKKPGA